MKIAIQGHPDRGKEVIQILESLGGVNGCQLKGNSENSYYFISSNNNIIHCCDKCYVRYKKYTLEEFEEEFPFKIGDEVIFPVINGWASGKITGIKDFEYEVNTIGGYRYVEPHKLSLYPMKEERNITLTLDKAKEWYKKGGELKEIALQAFTEEELTKTDLPKTWKEFCENYPIKKDESYINSEGKILSFVTTSRRAWDHICPSKKSAEAHLAMIQLEQLRDCWWNGWKPIWNGSTKYAIKISSNETCIVQAYNMSVFLVFPTKEMAEEFLECFRDLIEKAGDLI